MEALQQANGIDDPNVIIAGRVLTLPSGARTEGRGNTGKTSFVGQTNGNDEAGVMEAQMEKTISDIMRTMGVSQEEAVKMYFRALDGGKDYDHQIKFTNPTGRGIRNDGGGGGNYGDSRNREGGKKEPHEGVDFSADVGSNVVSPINGTLHYFIGASGKGVMDIFPNSFSGIDKVRMLYVDPTSEISPGQRVSVKKGQIIGTVISPKKFYTNPAITPHVHLQLFRDNTPINPTRFFFDN